MNAIKGVGVALAALAIVAVFVFNSYVDLIDPYRWDGPVIQDAQSAGYKVMQKIRGGEIIFPWTWFFPYTTNLAFVKPESVRPYRQFIGAEVSWVRREERGKIESSRTVSLFDCGEKVFTILADDKGRYDERIFRADGGPMMKWWIEMNDQMIAFFCNK